MILLPRTNIWHLRRRGIEGVLQAGTMASDSSGRPQFWLLLLVACFSCCLLIIPCSSSDEGAAAAYHTVDIVGRALLCFNDHYVYSACQASYRLGPEGALDVPPGSADAFCGGPCLAETELVLRCVDDIMANFRFYNGASAADVRFALDRGCGHSGLRGDFDVLQRLGAGGNYGDGHFYGRSVNNLAATTVPLLLMMSAAVVAILVWA